MRVTVVALLFACIGTMSATAAPVNTTPASVHASNAQPSFTEWSDQKRKPKRVQQSARVACTEFGCHPIPPGCVPVTGLDWRGYPLGYDRIVCRRR
jgi:hypothetical protein